MTSTMWWVFRLLKKRRYAIGIDVSGPYSIDIEEHAFHKESFVAVGRYLMQQNYIRSKKYGSG